MSKGSYLLTRSSAGHLPVLQALLCVNDISLYGPRTLRLQAPQHQIIGAPRILQPYRHLYALVESKTEPFTTTHRNKHHPPPALLRYGGVGPSRRLKTETGT